MGRTLANMWIKYSMNNNNYYREGTMQCKWILYMGLQMCLWIVFKNESRDLIFSSCLIILTDFAFFFYYFILLAIFGLGFHLYKKMHQLYVILYI